MIEKTSITRGRVYGIEPEGWEFKSLRARHASSSRKMDWGYAEPRILLDDQAIDTVVTSCIILASCNFSVSF